MEKVALMSAMVISLFFALGAISTHVEKRRRDAAIKHRSTVSHGSIRATNVAGGSFTGITPSVANRIGSVQHDDQQAASAKAIGG